MVHERFVLAIAEIQSKRSCAVRGAIRFGSHGPRPCRPWELWSLQRRRAGVEVHAFVQTAMCWWGQPFGSVIRCDRVGGEVQPIRRVTRPETEGDRQRTDGGCQQWTDEIGVLADDHVGPPVTGSQSIRQGELDAGVREQWNRGAHAVHHGG
jgi:hypothetical protein